MTEQSIDKYMKQWELLSITGGTINWYIHFAKTVWHFLK